MDVRWTNCGCVVVKKWMLWMFSGGEMDKMWICGGQNVDGVIALWM